MRSRPRTEATPQLCHRQAGLGSHGWKARFGRFDDAIMRLTSIQNQIRPLSQTNYLAQMFYSTLGELQLAPAS